MKKLKFYTRVAVFLMSVMFMVTIMSSCGVNNEDSRQFAIQIVYPNFEIYIKDFEKIKDLILESKRSDYYLMKVESNSTTLWYYSRETNDFVELELSLDELQSVKNIMLNSKNLRKEMGVYVRGNMVHFVCGPVDNGVMWTDNIDYVRKNTSDALQYTHLEDCWYAVLYYS